MTKTRFLAFITALALLLTIPTVAFAQSVAPHAFVGIVTLDGATAVDGTAVTAWVDGVEVEATTVYTNDDGDAGKYTLVVGDADGYADGTTVEFRVGDVTAEQTGSWEERGGDELDLSASSENASTEPPVVGPGGEEGEKGDAGATGATGASGASGATGTTGATGATGAAGAAGTAGTTGGTGATGATGTDGAIGATGAAGSSGSAGVAGGGGAIGIIALIVAIVAVLAAGGAYMMGRRT